MLCMIVQGLSYAVYRWSIVGGWGVGRTNYYDDYSNSAGVGITSLLLLGHLVLLKPVEATLRWTLTLLCRVTTWPLLWTWTNYLIFSAGSLRLIFRSSPSNGYSGFAASVICFQPAVADDDTCSPTAESILVNRRKKRDSVSTQQPSC